ncbi:hypothetical protein [Saccharicrinis fermentans]|uniref:hypothetical protein n=1 Tax=Saccharicrinis fermentans TaxID=982 RepID=UPI0004AEFF90|nr:hypothetical protein [Saccharicrinis fermentans]
MEDTYIQITYNEDADQFEAYKHSGHGQDLIYFDDDPEELAKMITDDIEELKASC